MKQNNPVKVLFVLVILLFVIFIAGLESRGISLYSITDTIIIKPFSSVISEMLRISYSTKNTFVAIKNSEQLKKENEDLKHQNAVLKERIKILSTLITENQRLKAALKIEKKERLNFNVANVIGLSSGPYKFLIIDKGTNQKIKKDEPVVDINPDESTMNLIGIVFESSKNTSKVLTCEDPRFFVSVKDVRSGDIGIAQGARNGLIINFKLTNPKVEIGDLLKTTSISDIYPEGIIVGEIDKIQKIGPYSTIVHIKPVIDLSNVMQAFVIRK